MLVMKPVIMHGAFGHFRRVHDHSHRQPGSHIVEFILFLEHFLLFFR